jgi:hypothetical protein
VIPSTCGEPHLAVAFDAVSATPNYYRILHVQPDAPASLIEASYRMLVKRAVSTGGAGKSLLDAAFAVLGDPKRRAAYDRELHDEQDASASATTTRTAGLRALEDTGASRLLNACLFCGTPHGLQRAFERDDECGRCGSPLYPAARQRLEVSGQRMLSRVPKRRTIAYFVTWPQSDALVGEMRDLSLNGMQFSTNVHLQLNQIVKIECPELVALGRVAHAALEAEAPEIWLTGIEFLTLRFRKSSGSFVSARV